MKNRTSGFSTIEVVTALVLIALTAMILFSFAKGAQTANSTIISRGIEPVRILEFKRIMDREFQNIRAPWWQKEAEIEVSSLGIKSSYWEGITDRTWTLKINEETISYGPEENPHRYQLPEGSRISLKAIDSNHSRKGVLFTVKQEGKTLRFSIYPGGRSLWVD